MYLTPKHHRLHLAIFDTNHLVRTTRQQATYGKLINFGTHYRLRLMARHLQGLHCLRREI